MKLLITSIIVTVIIDTAAGEPLKCYDCIGPESSECGDPFDEDEGVAYHVYDKSQCVCAKEILTFPNVLHYARGCLIPEKQLSRTYSTDLTVESYSAYYCRTDLCNGGNKFSAIPLTLTAVIVLSIFAN